MQEVMGIIKLTETGEFLKQITQDRTIAAVPFGGRYRVIDFVLSNLVNAGVRNIGIFTRDRYRALIEHLRSGKEWDLHRKRDGLLLFPPDFTGPRTGNFKGDLEYLQNHLDYLNRSRQNYVILAGGNMIYNFDYNELLEFHKETKADVTVMAKGEEVRPGDLPCCTLIETDAANRIMAMEVAPGRPKSNKVSMETYLMAKSLLIDLINTCLAQGQNDLVKDGLIKNLSRLKVYCYPFSGYLARINTVNSYYQHSMELLRPEVFQELFFRYGPIYTKSKDEPPAKYLGQAAVSNSLVASGCLIEGQVENSILFRGVKVARGAKIKDCVVFPKGVIEEGAVVEQAILDKEVTITRKKFIKGDASYPVVVWKHVII